jgi:hypothetical protein
MVFKRFFTKYKQENSFPEGLKWIYVSFVMYFEGTKKEISKIADDITNIINNTHSILDRKGQMLGYVNPYLNLNMISVSMSENGKIKNVPNLNCGGNKELTSLNLSRTFYPIIEKVDKRWRLTFIPEKTKKEDKTNLYSIENLNNDLWMLAGASNLICEKYGIMINEERPTYNPIIWESYPGIELHDHLLILKYHVHDAINFSKKDPKLFDRVLGHGETIFEIIKKISKHEPNSIWTKKVKNLLEE